MYLLSKSNRLDAKDGGELALLCRHGHRKWVKPLTQAQTQMSPTRNAHKSSRSAQRAYLCSPVLRPESPQRWNPMLALSRPLFQGKIQSPCGAWTKQCDDGGGLYSSGA